MKKQLLLYLFIVAVLMNVFTYMYFSKKGVSDGQSTAASVKRMKDSVVTLSDELYDANYFSLAHNDHAQNYLDSIDYRELEPLVKNELLSYNDSPDGNKYVDQAKMGEQKFAINKIKVLNGRWIIADFNNGQIWGEAFIRYFIKEDKTISFETVQAFIYPPE